MGENLRDKSRILQGRRFGMTAYLISVVMSLIAVTLNGCGATIPSPPELKYGTFRAPDTAYFSCSVNDFSAALGNIESGLGIIENTLWGDSCEFKTFYSEYVGNLTSMGTFIPKTYNDVWEYAHMTAIAMASAGGCLVSCSEVNQIFANAPEGFSTYEGSPTDLSVFWYSMKKIDASLKKPKYSISLPELQHGTFMAPDTAYFRCKVDEFAFVVSNMKSDMKAFGKVIDGTCFIRLEYESYSLKLGPNEARAIKSIRIIVEPSDSGCIALCDKVQENYSIVPYPGEIRSPSSYGLPSSRLIGSRKRIESFMSAIKKIDSAMKTTE